jgi:type IV fimbrial biogenesis protein FimT
VLKALPVRRHAGGFTLIELMVTIAIVALLMLAAVPSLGTWRADASIRNTAEDLLGAVRLAQSTAISSNRTTVLALTRAAPTWDAEPADNGSNWYVRTLPLSGSDEEAGPDDLLRATSVGTQNGVTITGPALLCFNSQGRQATKTADDTGMGTACTAPTNDVSEPTEYLLTRDNGRSLLVRVYLGGRVRLCDPAKTLSDSAPDGC